MTVSQLLSNTTSADLTEWEAFARVMNKREDPDAEGKIQKAFGAPNG